jgi:hypothetical protein
MGTHVQKANPVLEEVDHAFSFADDFTRELLRTAQGNWSLKADQFAAVLEDIGLISSAREEDPSPQIALAFNAIVLQARVVEHKMTQAPWDKKLQESSGGLWEIVQNNRRRYGFILPHTRH